APWTPEVAPATTDLIVAVGADLPPVLEGSNPVRERVAAMAELAQKDFFAEHCYPSDRELLMGWAKRAAELDEMVMVVPLHYDTRLLGFECDRYYPELIDHGVDLRGYSRAIVHSKIAVADGWYVSTGSYNLTLRSARADLEMQFFIQCPRYGSLVRELIRKDLALCEKVRPTALDRFRSRMSIPFADAFFRFFFF
ncbi:MAG: hypothetical protein D6806_10410, partial [Deltaproteobacteria bacterium]